jgi:hypothetical protein
VIARNKKTQFCIYFVNDLATFNKNNIGEKHPVYLTDDALKSFWGTLAVDWFLFIHSWQLIENWIDH